MDAGKRSHRIPLAEALASFFQILFGGLLVLIGTIIVACVGSRLSQGETARAWGPAE